MKFKILITTAGVGSRIHIDSMGLNKGLFSLANKPVISHILDLFPIDIPVVIVLGYQAEIVKEAIIAMHPDRVFEFAIVDKYEGDGSGLGKSILAAKDLLQCPFIFSPNDCFPESISWNIDPNHTGNWVLGIGAERISDLCKGQYCGLSVSENKLDQLLVKGYESNFYYSGLCGIKDYEKFWEFMEDEKDLTIGESAALRKMDNVTFFQSKKWFDVGNKDALSLTENYFKESQKFNILKKSGETIWFHGHSVVKVFKDDSLVRDRLERLKFLPSDLMPNIQASGKHFYKYDFFNGVIMSKTRNRNIFLLLFNEMNNKVWSRKFDIQPNEKNKIITSFYKDKTIERLELFSKTRGYHDKEDFINGSKIPSVRELIGKINWEKISEYSIFSNFHGDFHNENILYDRELNRFRLIDWRQNFAGIIEYGDIYYDFAKFLHGLIVSHQSVVRNEFMIENNDEGYSIDIQQSFFNRQIQLDFKKWLKDNNYNYSLVLTLTSLIFINIAPLHHSKYDLFLMELGRSMLFHEFQKKDNIFIN